MAGKKYICIKAWARNKQNDLIMDWELKKYPAEIQKFHFEEFVEKKKVNKESKPLVAASTLQHKETKPLILDSNKNKTGESVITG